MNLEIRYLRDDVLPPFRAYRNSAAYDIAAHLLTTSGRPYTVTIPPRATVAIPTGIAIRPPPGFFAQCCSRSGLAGSSVFIANAPGIIDPDYTGELMVLLYNGGFEPFYVKHHDRIMQMICTPFHVFPLRTVEEFPDTARGERGFGSTGL